MTSRVRTGPLYGTERQFHFCLEFKQHLGMFAADFFLLAALIRTRPGKQSRLNYSHPFFLVSVNSLDKS